MVMDMVSRYRMLIIMVSHAHVDGYEFAIIVW